MHFFNINPRSFSASRTSLIFNCSRYRTPPCINFVLREEVPFAKSNFQEDDENETNDNRFSVIPDIHVVNTIKDEDLEDEFISETVNFDEANPVSMPGHADYEPVKRMRGFAYYVVEKDGKPALKRWIWFVTSVVTAREFLEFRLIYSRGVAKLREA